MRHRLLILTATATALLSLAPALADGGKAAVGSARFPDGTQVEVAMRYDRQLASGELWMFDLAGTRVTECAAIGSLDNGFTSGAGCATPFATGRFGGDDAGARRAPIVLAGRAGTLTVVGLPDAGL